MRGLLWLGLCLVSSLVMGASFKVLTINVAQLPEPIGMGRRAERIDLLAERIHQYKEDPDVICVQELFSYSARKSLFNKIKHKYPYSYIDWRVGRKLFGVGSGLAIFSKLPMADKVLYQYQNQVGDGNFTRKGVMGLKLQRSPGKFIYVFTTHMQAGRSELFYIFDFYKDEIDTNKIGMRQVEEASKVIHQFMQEDHDSPAFYAGDFNICYHREHSFFEQILRSLGGGAVDTFSKDRSRIPSTTWEDLRNNKLARIDYIFSLNPRSQMLRSGYSVVTDFFTEDITDHLGVLGTFHLAD